MVVYKIGRLPDARSPAGARFEPLISTQVLGAMVMLSPSAFATNETTWDVAASAKWMNPGTWCCSWLVSTESPSEQHRATADLGRGYHARGVRNSDIARDAEGVRGSQIRIGRPSIPGVAIIHRVARGWSAGIKHHSGGAGGAGGRRSNRAGHHWQHIVVSIIYRGSTLDAVGERRDFLSAVAGTTGAAVVLKGPIIRGFHVLERSDRGCETRFVIGLAIARKIAARNEDDLVHLAGGAEQAISQTGSGCPETGMVRSLGQDVDHSGRADRAGIGVDYGLHCVAK